MSRSQPMPPMFPDETPQNGEDLLNDPAIQALANLVVPGELAEWGDPEESATEDRMILDELAALRRAAAEHSQ